MNFFSCEGCVGERRELCEAAGAKQLEHMTEANILGRSQDLKGPTNDEDDIIGMSRMTRYLAGIISFDEALGDEPPSNSKEAAEHLVAGMRVLDEFMNTYNCTLDKDRASRNIIIRSIDAHNMAGLAAVRSTEQWDMSGLPPPPVDPPSHT